MDSAACTVHPHLVKEIRFIQLMDIRQRSLLIKLCQAQKIPPPHLDEYLSKGLDSSPPLLKPMREGVERLSFREVCEFILDEVTPVKSALILDLCRSLPLSNNEILEAQRNSWEKEIIPCETTKKERRINWRCVFRPECFEESILPGVPPNPPMARHIFSCLRRWLHHMDGCRLFPRMTTKWMSRAAARDASEMMRLPESFTFSQQDAQRLYMETGYKCQGESEMRQKWYPHGAKPRTYYAQGGVHYFASCHLQEVFTSMVNCFTPTNHFERLKPTRLHVSPDGTYRIYDFSSFTSNFDEQESFVEELSRFCAGVMVEVIDCWEGPLWKDLGGMIADYNHICNRMPEVSYERFRDDDGMGVIACHARSSMLGIFGNLMTDTLAHGIGLGMALGDRNEDSFNVAGDDGLYDETEYNRDTVQFLMLPAMGTIEWSKSFSVSDSAPICLKRPIKSSGGVLEVELAIIPPNLSLIRHHIFGVKDPRYSFGPELDWNGRVSVVGKDLIRYLRSAHLAQHVLSDEDLQTVCNVVERVRTICKIPENGCLPQTGLGHYFFPSRMYPDELRYVDPLRWLVFRNFTGHAVVHVRDSGSPFSLSLQDLQVGDSFICTSNKRLALLRKLGILKSEEVRKVVFGAEAFQELLNEYVKGSPSLYEYVVVKDIPMQFMSL